MLFSSQEFLFYFLPSVVALFWVMLRFFDGRGIVQLLVASSLFFYGWWNPIYLGLLAISVVGNYGIYRLIISRKVPFALSAGLIFNLGMLGYFKYAGLFSTTLNQFSGIDIGLHNIALPLAISFFTFQQIAFLVDAKEQKLAPVDFTSYLLFVTFFPQLIAGPIVHHAEMMPQFQSDRIKSVTLNNLWVGTFIFSLGLYKKIILADSVGIIADRIYAPDVSPNIIEAWAGTLAYAFQIYFDFSGYSDMAIGVARIFGIILPLNFFSPYKATSIIEFWQRWHITLSRFLRDYLYIKLGGNRKGEMRRYINLMLTMVLGGLWHGAGWNFVIWGALHGSYLGINHAYRSLFHKTPHANSTLSFAQRFTLRLVTFICVLIAWVFFRATTFDGALIMIEAMFSPISLTTAIETFNASDLLSSKEAILLGIASIICFYLPNTVEISAPFKPTLEFTNEALDQPKFLFSCRSATAICNFLHTNSRLLLIILCLSALFISLCTALVRTSANAFIYMVF